MTTFPSAWVWTTRAPWESFWRAITHIPERLPPLSGRIASSVRYSDITRMVSLNV